MARCVNCGRRIVANSEPALCRRCQACDTIYAALIVQIKRKAFITFRSTIICLVAALALHIASCGRILQLTLLYFALADMIYSGAQCLAQYIQLRRKLHAEKRG